MKKKIFTILVLFVFLLPCFAENDKPNVLVVYYSARGHTKAMAEAVAGGAKLVTMVDVKVLTIDEAKKKDILDADAIIVGSPVYNANIVPQVQKFINSWPFKNTPLKNKIGAAFVSAGGISAGEETAMLSILRSMLIFEMIVVGGPTWRTAFGASAIVEEEPFGEESSETKLVADPFLDKARQLGERVAELAKLLNKAKTNSQNVEK